MTATEIACLCIGAAGILTALLSLPFFCRGRALSKNALPGPPALSSATASAAETAKPSRRWSHIWWTGNPTLPTGTTRALSPPTNPAPPVRETAFSCQSGMFSTSTPPACSATAGNSPQRSGPLAVPCPWSTIPAIPSRLRGKAGQPWRYGRRDIALHRRGTGGFRRRNVFALSITERNLHDDLTIRTKYFQNIHGAQSSRQCVVLPQ